MDLPRDYQGRNVVITGAAGGLGLALAWAFGEAGARVAMLDIDGAAAIAAAERLGRKGIVALGLPCDVSDAASTGAAFEAVLRAFGGIDVVVLNAGISARCLFVDMQPAVLERVLAVNFFGAVFGAQAALPSLRARRGQIIVISSVAGFSPLVGRTAYAASKHALHGFFESLRSELHGSGVDVTMVCPAFISTGIDRAAIGADGRQVQVTRQMAGGAATPAATAGRILAAARRRQRLCLPSTTSRLAWWLSRLAPARFERLMLARQGAEFDLPNPMPGSPT